MKCYHAASSNRAPLVAIGVVAGRVIRLGQPVYADLAIAVIIGVIVSAPVYAWNAARHIQARERLGGKDRDRVVRDFADGRVVDPSALLAMEGLALQCDEAGKRIELRHLSRDCHKLLIRPGR